MKGHRVKIALGKELRALSARVQAPYLEAQSVQVEYIVGPPTGGAPRGRWHVLVMHGMDGVRAYWRAKKLSRQMVVVAGYG
ncbi:MAG: hypothetical protein OXU20_18205 [Myxococcales bacterium]|nr:hypothetical protein [Myxococcales bacterium]